ncbi:hypothetical protein ACFQZI_02145 [Mucilaginibacter lutimaris]|uniref:VWA domain-containing protein n=1 Tax=Mucilaginibacter lutimaris TaxID=931629 RepID=A0ABW2ZAL0_9SPHI
MQANWTYIVTTLCVLLAIGFTWQEYRRVNKRNLWLRILAVIIAVASLACIALPITYNGVSSRSAERKVILLTDGFDVDSIKAADTSVVTTDIADKKRYPKAKLINSLDELNKTDQLHVYGYGLRADELAQLDSMPFIFHPAKAPSGISHVSWNGHLKAGEPLHVQGIYNNTSAQKVKLVLSGLNTGLDSVILPANTQTSFSLSASPKTTGKMVFSLSTDTAVQGSIPIQVSAVKPLKILMLSASPDFESKFLKNWLTGNGYAVALRSVISKGKFNSEYINIAQFNSDKLSAQIFDEFDVVIGDLSVLNGLSPAEEGALKQAVTDNGLGLIVRADTIEKTSWLQRQFPVDRAGGKEPGAASVIINGKSSIGKLNYGMANIIYRNGTKPLVKTAHGEILASNTIVGSGRVVFTTINSTFSWMLRGNNADYNALWSALITNAARKDNAVQDEIEFLSPPYIGSPVQLQFAQGKASPVIINNETVAIVQSPNVPFEYTAQYWPAASGWQNMQGKSWYVFANSDWRAAQAATKLSATEKYAKSHEISGNVTKQIQQKVRIDVPKIYFYILLLAACTFLWVETKGLS